MPQISSSRTCPSPGQQARHRLSIYRQKDSIDDEFLSVANYNKTKE
jgi:hypothetical protein